MTMASRTDVHLMDDAESALRDDLAAAFRLAAKFGWSESVGNHFSAAVSQDGTRFLLNPRWRHFSAIGPDDLLLLDANDPATMDRPDAPDPSAWCIHGAVHRTNPKARVLLHCHPPNATALACLKDPELKPIDLNTARFYRRIAYDRDFGGMADKVAEGQRIATAIGENAALIMCNHGVAVSAETVPEAFEHLYFLERACATLLKAYGSGQPLNELSPELAASTADEWDAYADMAFAHFVHLKAELEAGE